MRINPLQGEVRETSEETHQKTAPNCVPRFLTATPSALTPSQTPGPSVSPTLGEFSNQLKLKEIWNQVKYRLGVQKVAVHKTFFSCSSLFSSKFYFRNHRSFRHLPAVCHGGINQNHNRSNRKLKVIRNEHSWIGNHNSSNQQLL